MLDSLSTIKGQYEAPQDALMDISRTLGVKPLNAVKHIKVLLKKKEMEDLQAQINCLLKENSDLKDWNIARKVQAKEREELKARIISLEAKVAKAQNQRDEATTVAWKFDEFVRNPSDVVNKAKLYDKGMSRSAASLGPMIVQFLVDYHAKVEKVLVGI